jgi:hypothetical protein
LLALAADLAAATSPLTYERTEVLDNGTGANQANEVWSDTRTLTTGANETLDLNGVLVDAVGQSVAFTKVKLLYHPQQGHDDPHGRRRRFQRFVSPFGSATDVVKVPAGGMLLLYAPDANGFAVTPRPPRTNSRSRTPRAPRATTTS